MPPPQPPATTDGKLESSMILRSNADTAGQSVPVTATGVMQISWTKRMATLEALMLIRVVVFFIKIVSLSQPCLPAAPKATVYYPLIGLAILDFTAPSLPHTIFLAAIHVGVLILVRIFGEMCMY